MFQATRRRLALWYTTVTAVLLLLFASGFYVYVRSTLVERVDDTLSHVAEVVERSLVIEATPGSPLALGNDPPLRINIEASFRDNADTVEDDHIDLEWFSPTGELLWSTLAAPLEVPLHPNHGETVHVTTDQLLRQVTQRVQVGRQVLGYLRVSHPWFEVTKPSRQLIIDLSIGTVLIVVAVAATGWLLSGLAIAPIRESYQRLKQFTADASHELRNPLAVIQTNVQVALSDPEPDLAFQQDQLKVVERITRRLGRLVDDLLFLARQDSGISPLNAAWVSLDELLLEVVEEQQAIASEKGVQLSLDLPPPTVDQTEHLSFDDSLYTLMGDRDQLIRLFTNLVSNAVQYTPAQEQVQVTLKRMKSHGIRQLEIQVRDTGIGIPAEALPNLFDRFYRVDPARTANGQGCSSRGQSEMVAPGSGLGLAIAKTIVENHQGQIQVESVANRGTTFTVLLPWQEME